MATSIQTWQSNDVDGATGSFCYTLSKEREAPACSQSSTSQLHEFLSSMLDHVKMDDTTKMKLKQLVHFDAIERESMHVTLNNCLAEIDRLHHIVLKRSDGVNSNQVDEDSARPEDDNNPADHIEEKTPAIAGRGAKYHIAVATDSKPPRPLPSPASTTASTPLKSTSSHTSSIQGSARRRSSLRRKSVAVVGSKNSPGKVSVSPAKHGMANQLVLVKTKTPKTKAADGDTPQQRWAIKIARKFKPLNLSLFSFHPAAGAIPTPVLELGPQQNALMLRQLRYVKGVMHDLPWAKGRLRDMLSQYTQKELSKELLYPQLGHLSTQVQEELQAKSKAQKSLLETKSKLTVTLQLAKNVINDLQIIKFGRRGKPHDTKLFYDECHPSMLYWQSKQGERSAAFLPLHSVKSIEAGIETVVLKKAAKKQTLDPDCCLSLVTEERTLDLKMKNPLQRDWLLKALREVIDYAVQYRATFTAKKSLNLTPRLRRM
ncbi:unnamed protein product [Aphanomyces euteiches]|nr:hypothetical protein Ae201684P_016794 [Aphanomyces euteiches]